MRVRSHVSPAAPALAASAVASPSAVAAAGTVDFNAFDYGYSLPDTVSAGEVTFVMHNAGSEAHHAQLIKLNDGVTFAQFSAAMSQNPNAAFGLAALVGGNGALNPGSGSDQVTLDLQPGAYVVLCFLAGADGVPHFAKGMITVTLRDFAFDTSTDTLPSGRSTWRITNAGPHAHEIQVARLAAGGSANDILSFFATQSTGAPPASAVGGFQSVGPNDGGFLTLDLTPGQYAFYCALPDLTKGGLKHVQEGMLKQVTVQ